MRPHRSEQQGADPTALTGRFAELTVRVSLWIAEERLDQLCLNHGSFAAWGGCLSAEL